MTVMRYTIIHNFPLQAGDDLRQDSLTLQTIGLMDELWQNENMDLKYVYLGLSCDQYLLIP